MKKFSVFLSACFLFVFLQIAIAQQATEVQSFGQLTPNNNSQPGPTPAAIPSEVVQANDIDELPALESILAVPAQAVSVQEVPVQTAPAIAPPTTLTPAPNSVSAPAQYLPPAPNINQASAANKGPSESELAEAKKLGPVTVGRIGVISGEVQRYIDETKEWVVVAENTPLGVRDSIISSEETKAEVIFPNNVIWRMGRNTHATVAKLDSELLEIRANAGLVRFLNAGKAIVSYVTDYGTIQADGGTVFEAYISKEAVEVKSLKGTVYFIAKDNQKYDVQEKQNSVLADNEAVTAGRGFQDQDWTAWNNRRAGIWNDRAVKSKKYVKYLPKELYLDAYMLDENGDWTRANIDGVERVVYRPRVATTWQPFVNGQWVDYYGDQTFVSYDSFGYITHHYGNWIMANGVWVWAPPYTGTVVVGSPYLPIEYAYYPGRVSFVNTAEYVGWVPLYYTEPYCPAYWGGYYGYYGYHGYYPYHDYYGNYYGHDYHHVDVHVSGLYYGGHGCYVGHNNFYGHHGGYGNVRFNGDHHSFSNLRASNRFDGSRIGGHNRFMSSDRKASFRPDRNFGERMRNNNLGSRMGGKREGAGALRNNWQNAKRGNFADRPARSIMERKSGDRQGLKGFGQRQGNEGRQPGKIGERMQERRQERGVQKPQMQERRQERQQQRQERVKPKMQERRQERQQQRVDRPQHQQRQQRVERPQRQERQQRVERPRQQQRQQRAERPQRQERQQRQNNNKRDRN